MRNTLRSRLRFARHLSCWSGAVVLVLCMTGSSPALSQTDLAARIEASPGFYQHLACVGPSLPSSAENQSLQSVCERASRGGFAAVAADLERFVGARPGSAWTPSLRANLGYYYSERGVYSKALEHWETAWPQLRAERGPGAKANADFILAHWTKTLAALGRKEELRQLLVGAGSNPLDGGPLGQLLIQAREQYALMLADPQSAHQCGLYAVQALARALNSPAPGLVNQAQVPATGFSLSQLSEIAAGVGLEMEPVEWGPARRVPVPSVMHGKSLHFITVLSHTNGVYRVFDPSSPHLRVMGQEELVQEASGAFLVPRQVLAQGWSRLAQTAALRVAGRGTMSGATDDDDGCGNGGGGGNPPGSGGGGHGGTAPPMGPISAAAGASQFFHGPIPGCNSCGGGDGGGGGGGGGGGTSCCSDDGTSGGDGGMPTARIDAPAISGMPLWEVSEPYINVFLYDEPLGYQPGLGPRVSFRLAYKQRESRVIDSNFFSLGNMWNCSWLSYVTDTRYWNDVFVPGGGKRRWDTGQPDQMHKLSHTTRQRYVDGSGVLTNFVVTYPSGAKESYGFSPSIPLNGDRVLLLTEKVDPFGNTNRLVYLETNSMVKLLYVVDADGHTNTLGYGDALFPTQVTTVTDPTGRTTTLQYDAANGMLTNVTDVASLSSSFAYDSQGWISRMVTPYGTNTFLIATNNPGMAGNEFTQGTNTDLHFIIRSVKIIDPVGGTNVYLLYQDAGYVYNPATGAHDAPFLANGYPTNVIPSGVGNLDSASGFAGYRNSFHWGPWQASFIPSDLTHLAPNDFAKARLRHWVHVAGTLTVSQSISIEKEPNPDGTTNTLGQTTWFSYDGQIYPFEIGTESLPAIVARVVPDGSTWYTWYRRDQWGHPTNVVETWSTGYGATPLARTNVFIYDANGVDLVTHLGPQGELLGGYYYDANHHLLRATNAVHDVSYYSYDSRGRLSGSTTPTLLTRTNVYFDSGAGLNRLAYAYEFDATRTYRSNAFTYANGLVQTRTDERGVPTTSYWDNLQRLTGVSYPDGSSISNIYTLLDLTATRDRLGYWSYFGYDRLRHRVTETNANGVVTGYGYCACGLLSSVTNGFASPAQQLTTFAYDCQGNRTYTYLPDATFTVWYNSLRQPAATLDGQGYRYFNYNNQGLLHTVSNAFGFDRVTVYDSEDRPLYVTDANAVTVTNTYDPLGRLLSRSYPDGGSETFGYVPAGLFAYTNQIGASNFFAYNAAGWKTFETNANNELVQYRYDGSGNLTNLIDGKTQSTRWTYDEYSRVTNKIDNAGTVILRYAYDSGSRLTNRWSAAKGNTAYAYDPIGNLTNINYPVSPDVRFQYDPLNRLTNMVDAVGTTAYSYTSGGLLWTEDGPFASDTVTNSYSNRYRVALSLQQPTGAWTNGFIYDWAGRLTNVTSAAGAFGYTHDAQRSALITRLSLPNSCYISNAFDNVARLTGTWLNNSLNTTLDSSTYAYNLAGQRTGFTNLAGTAVGYRYDNIGQLKVADSSVNTEDRGYFYDSAWNLNRLTNNGATSTFSVDSLNQLTSAPAGTCSYDSNGNLVQVTGNDLTAYFYDDENRLIVITNGPGSLLLSSSGPGPLSPTPTGGWKTEFTYDGKSRLRIRKDYYAYSTGYFLTNTTWYIYDGNRVIQERDGSNVPTVSYTRGSDLSGTLEGAGGIGGLLGRSHGYSAGNWSTHNFYHADGNGNITALVDSSQALTASYRYDPFGNLISKSGTLADANLYRFSSKEFHVNSGLYYYLYRFYSPSLDRWVNKDPLADLSFLKNYIREKTPEARSSIMSEALRNAFQFVHNAPPQVLDINGLEILIYLPDGGTTTPIGPYPVPQYPTPPWQRDLGKSCAEWGAGCAVIGACEGGPAGAVAGGAIGALAGFIAYWAGQFYDWIF